MQKDGIQNIRSFELAGTYVYIYVSYYTKYKLSRSTVACVVSDVR